MRGGAPCVDDVLCGIQVDRISTIAHSRSMSSPAKLSSARAELGRRIENWLELPMSILGAVWLLLLVADFLNAATPLTETFGTGIWVTFLAEFALRFTVAPAKGRFVRRNWITALSLVLPAFRVLRFARLVRLMRAGGAVRLRLARLLTSFNRAMRTLGTTTQSRGFPAIRGERRPSRSGREPFEWSRSCVGHAGRPAAFGRCRAGPVGSRTLMSCSREP